MDVLSLGKEGRSLNHVRGPLMSVLSILLLLVLAVGMGGSPFPAQTAAADPASPPDDSGTPAATGPLPTVTSSWSPEGSLADGATRTYTVSYHNDGTTAIANGRFWHETTAAVNATIAYSVSCEASGGASCPAAAAVTAQTINATADTYYKTFAFIGGLPAGGQLTFTVTTTVTMSSGCATTATPFVGGWARFSRTSFDAASTATGDLASASNAGTITVSSDNLCGNEPVDMENNVTSPGPSGAPSRVLSGDERTFQASWTNTRDVPVTFDLRYTYYVPYTGQVTVASWSCASTIDGVAGGTCPTTADGGVTSPETVHHDNAGEASDVIFAYSGTTLAAGQTLTFTITLATTITTCTQDGYLRVQTYAKRSVLADETDSDSHTLSRPSELVEIGCSTWLMEEDFNSAAVGDSTWKGIGKACLTKATTAGSSGSLGKCSSSVRAPTSSYSKGFLQLTDDQGSQVGAALYNRALPSKNGLVLEFTQHQYGNGDHADGIGFFLADGSQELTTTGSSGGGLGYANKNNENGLPNAYLGVGLDVYGNFADNSTDVTSQCTRTDTSSTRKTDSITLRGPGALNSSGQWRSGYCPVGDTVKVSSLNSSYSLHGNTSHSSNNLTESQLNALLADYSTGASDTGSGLKTRITVYPLKSGETAPEVTVEIDFGEGYYTTVLDRTMTEAAPDLIKFGFLGSTGGSSDTHLISGLRVGTVTPMQTLDLTKTVSSTQSTYSVGDQIQYQFLATNSDAAGGIFQFSLDDPQIDSGTLSCPATTIGVSNSITCTGTHTVTEADRDVGQVVNTATAHGATSESGDVNLSATDTATAVVNPAAPDDSRVIQPGGTATFQLVDDGTTPGIVSPDDAAKVTVTLTVDGQTVSPGGSATVAGEGTWALDTDGTVIFTPADASYTGTVTSVTYTATNQYGGSATGTLGVTINTAPLRVCTADEQRASQRYWAFGDAAQLDFGTNGTSVAAGTFTGLDEADGTVTVTDSAGNLQFVVAGGSILDASGGAMTDTDDGAVTLDIGAGASPATVFPAAQGTGRYYVVWSTATTATAGQLKYAVVDMTEGAHGAVTTAPTAVGTGTNASGAVASVPNADGTGYWVLNPQRVNDNSLFSTDGYTLDAWQFTANGPATAPVTTPELGTSGVTSSTDVATAYEDIRFSPDLTQAAAISSVHTTGGTLSANYETHLHLLGFDAATGTLTEVKDQIINDSRGQGYSVEYGPEGSDALFVSTLITDPGENVARLLQYSKVSEQSSVSIWNANVLKTSSLTGAIRLAPDGRLYWAHNTSALTVLTNPGTATSDSNAEFTTLDLGSGTPARQGLTNTLTDCAISPTGFTLHKLGAGAGEDGSDAAVDGAEFALYPNDDGQAGADTAATLTPVDGQTGVLTVDGLAPGYYWLRETKAPAGYALLADDVRVHIALRGEVTVQNTGGQNPQVQLTAGGDGTYTITVTDTKTYQLPFTGGWWLFALLLAGGGLLAGVLARAIQHRRQHDEDLTDTDDHTETTTEGES